MYSSCSRSKRLVSTPFLVVVATQLLFIYNVSSLNLTNTYLHHKCLVSQGYYKPGSAYEKNLQFLIKTTSTSDFRSGFTHDTGGERPDSTTILYQCRGDSYWSKCRHCYNAALSELRKRCPRNKGGIIWFDQCFLEISVIHVLDGEDKINYKNIFSMHNPKQVSGDAKVFNKETISFLEKLTIEANDKNNKNEDQIALYAAGETKLGTKKLYAMVQCTRYIYMPKLCKVCLETLIRNYFPKCCDGKQGGRVVGTSCNFRYELYPFLRTNKTVS